MLSEAAFLALAMRCAPGVHPDTSLDVAGVESSLHPYAIGIVDEPGRYPLNKDGALLAIQELKAAGKNYSVGVMQINQSNFDRYGVTVAELLDPCTNLSVFERILTDCFERGKTLRRALSCYYSGNMTTGTQNESAFGSSYIGRIGYRVPSSREDKQRDTTHTKEQAHSSAKVPPSVRVVYPDRVLKAAIVAAPYPTKIIKSN